MTVVIELRYCKIVKDRAQPKKTNTAVIARSVCVGMGI